MPHLRKRHALESVKKLAKFSPLVGVLGHRQVGKTTLLEGLCNSYHTLDLPSELDSADADPVGYLNQRSIHLTAIDECQLSPGLFPAMKEKVRKDKRPGQYLLSGSVKFTARKEIHESLTGRLMDIELLPFSACELEEKPLPDVLIKIMTSDLTAIAKKLSRFSTEKTRQMIDRYNIHGGLPGVCFIRNESMRIQKIDAQLRTILGKDLQLILKTTVPIIKLRELLKILSFMQAEPIIPSMLARQSRISLPTLNKLIAAFEDLFLIRTLPTEGGMSRSIVFFEDQGEASRFFSAKDFQEKDLIRFFYANARTQFSYRLDAITEWFQYRTRGGALVPVVIRREGKELGVIPLLTENPDRSAINSAASFLKSYPNGRIVFIHAYSKIEVMSSKMLIAPVSSVVF